MITFFKKSAILLIFLLSGATFTHAMDDKASQPSQDQILHITTTPPDARRLQMSGQGQLTQSDPTGDNLPNMAPSTSDSPTTPLATDDKAGQRAQPEDQALQITTSPSDSRHLQIPGQGQLTPPNPGSPITPTSPTPGRRLTIQFGANKAAAQQQEFKIQQRQDDDRPHISNRLRICLWTMAGILGAISLTGIGFAIYRATS